MTCRQIPFAQVRSEVRCGIPLPWNIRAADGTLLLIKGHVIATADLLEALQMRAAFVDWDSDQTPGPVDLPQGALFSVVWPQLEARLAQWLRRPADPRFLWNIREIAHLTSALARRHPDQLLFTLLQPEPGRLAAYPVTHSLHVAAVCSLLADRLHWPQQKQLSVVGAALTMNLAMLELQSQLSTTNAGLTVTQANEVHAHPALSAELLRQAGLTDEDWLQAVRQHHERLDGAGYPDRIQDPGELSQMLRLVDTFLAKHTPRAGRPAVSPQRAAQTLYLQNKDETVAALLVKEFGLYPPGCVVKLANGDTAVVVRRGPSVQAPEVVSLISEFGVPLARPLWRRTSEAAYAVVMPVQDAQARSLASARQLYET